MREMKKIFAGILMTVLLTGCSSQEILSEVPQTIVLPEEQIDSLPMQEEDPTSAETENTESFSSWRREALVLHMRVWKLRNRSGIWRSNRHWERWKAR